MVQDGQAPGSAGLQLAGGAPLLRPEEQVLAAMLAFTPHADGFPWAGTAQMVEGWLGDLRAVKGLRRSTIRNYALAVSGFCRYLTDPAYGWAAECQARVGTHPVQVCHEWNTAVHVQEAEGDPSKRAFTVDELQAFFDHADEQVRRVRGRGRKGWLPVFRDATAFKVAYGFGLRRTETAMLDLADFGANPHAAEFGDYGLCRVRFGKASKGSPTKRRSVLTVWPWLPGVLDQWIEEARPLMGTAADSPALWPSERGQRIGVSALNRRFTESRDALGL